jgi:hypothetical protein
MSRRNIGLQDMANKLNTIAVQLIIVNNLLDPNCKKNTLASLIEQIKNEATELTNGKRRDTIERL